MTYFFFLYRSPSSLFTVFDSISSNIDEVLSINPSANVFVFGDFHHKDWLTNSGGTDRPGELCYNFSILNDLTQMVSFPTRVSNCDSHSPALLEASIYLFLVRLVFFLQWLSIHWDILIMLLSQFPFPLSIKFTTGISQPFHRIAYDYFRGDWDGLRDHLKDVPWEDIFKIVASAATSEFCGWVQVRIDVYIPHRKYSHSSPWFSADCAAAIVHGNHYFLLYQKDKSSNSKVKFRQISNRCKRVLEGAKACIC